MSWAVLDELEFEAIRTDASRAVDVFERVGRVLARTDAATLTDDELLESVGGVERTRRQLDATAAHLAAELEARGVTDERRGLRTGPWIALETREHIGAARRRVTLATQIRSELPAVDEALTDGRIGWSHVQVLCAAAKPRILVLFRLKVPFLIELAGELAFQPWCREVDAVARRLDVDGGYQPEDDPEGSRLYLDRLTGDDVALLRGVFAGEKGLTLTQVIEERTDRLWRRYRDDHKNTSGAVKIPSRAALRAEALYELVVEARGADPTRSKGPVADLTVALRLDVSELFPNGLTPDARSTTGGAELAGLLADGRYLASRLYETVDGRDVSARSIEHRLCDAAVTFLTTNADGVPLDMGRTIRYAHPDQRRAAKVRDGGCAREERSRRSERSERTEDGAIEPCDGPGCDCRPDWCDLHHLRHYAHGGGTDLTNLPMLCRFHHGVVHRNGWAMFEENGWYWFRTPRGDTFWGQHHQKQRAGPTPNAP